MVKVRFLIEIVRKSSIVMSAHVTFSNVLSSNVCSFFNNGLLCVHLHALTQFQTETQINIIQS